MKKSSLSLVLLFLLSDNLFGFSGKGDGTEASPYQITTIDRLQEMNDDLYAYYSLMNNIDASETKSWNIGDHDNDPSTPDSAAGFKPIGSYEDHFIGSFNGNSHEINDLYINRPADDNVGLFCFLDFSAPADRITNLFLKNVDIRGLNQVGGLAGNYRSYIIENVKVSGIISGKEYVGGLLGKNLGGGGVVIDSYTSVSVHGISYVGGLVGWNLGPIIHCGSQGSVTGAGSCGGLVGTHVYNEIKDSYSTSDVFGLKNMTTFDGDIGGFVGVNQGIIRNSYSGGNVQGDLGKIGGFVGWCCCENYDNPDIQNCYATGDVVGNNRVGGFLGRFDGGVIKYCYSVGKVTADNRSGGFVGSSNLGTVYRSFWVLSYLEWVIKK